MNLEFFVAFCRNAWTRLSDGRGVAAGGVTSFLTRVAGMATTLVAMPIALHTLGDIRFGAFLLLFGVINWMTLGSFGVQNALGRAIASKTVAREDVPHMLGAALVYALITSAITASAVSAAFLIWRFYIGVHLGLPLVEVTTAAGIMIALSAVQIVFQVFEGARIGNLEYYAVNLTRLIGSMFSFFCLLTLPRLWPNMAVFVIALNGGLLLGAILNAGLVMRDIQPNFSRLKKDIQRLRGLAVSGFAFLVIGTASLLQTHVPVLILASIYGPASVIDFGLFIRLLFVLITGLAMVTTPLWPALLHARAETDLAWVKKSLRISAVLVIGAGLLACGAISLFGAHIIFLWTKHRLVEPSSFKYLFGIYFLQMAWSHYWATVLMGLGRERAVSLFFIIEAAIMISLGTLLSLRSGPTGMILGLVVGFASVTNWILPMLAIRHLQRIMGQAPAEVALAAIST